MLGAYGQCSVSHHRVTEDGHPSPVPTERGVRISRTTLFGSWFTALQVLAAPGIRGALDQKAATRHIADWAKQHIDDADRARFIEEAESKLLSMHEGNFARFQVRPSEFDAWRQIWERKPGKTTSTRS